MVLVSTISFEMIEQQQIDEVLEVAVEDFVDVDKAMDFALVAVVDW